MKGTDHEQSLVITGAGGGIGVGTPTLLFSHLPSNLLKKQS